MSNDVNITINLNKLRKAIEDGVKTNMKPIHAGMRGMCAFIAGKVQRGAPIKSGTLRSSTVIDDPELNSVVRNKAGDVLQSEKTPEGEFRVRQAIDYAEDVYERPSSETGDPKILLHASMETKSLMGAFMHGINKEVKSGSGENQG